FVRNRRTAGAACPAGPPLGAGIAALALPPGPLRGGAQVARLGAADGALYAAVADGRRRRSDHQEQLAWPLQISAQPDRLLARQCRRTDRRLRHHALGAVAVRAAVEGHAPGGPQDDDPAQRVRLYWAAVVRVLLGADGTAQRGRPAGLWRGGHDHRRGLQLRRHVYGRVGVLAAAGRGLLLRRRRLRHRRALCGGSLALTPQDFGHGIGLRLRRHRQDHRAGRPRFDRGLGQLPQARRALAANSYRFRLSRLLVLDGRGGVLFLRAGDPGQVDRADRQGTGRHRLIYLLTPVRRGSPWTR